MKQDLSGLLSKKYDELEIDQVVSLPFLERGGEIITFPLPAIIRGKLYKLEDSVIIFSGELETVAETICSRCLKKIEDKFSVAFEEVVYAEGKEEEYDLILESHGEELDLVNFILNVLQLKLPMKFLCDDDCKGLCPICGTNLNISECDCKHDDIDERLVKLKELL